MIVRLVSGLVEELFSVHVQLRGGTVDGVIFGVGFWVNCSFNSVNLSVEDFQATHSL